MNFSEDTLSTVLFGLVVGIVVYGVRKSAEGVRPTLPSSKFWTEVVLYWMPLVLGGTLAPALGPNNFPFPKALTSWQALAMYGTVVGAFSGIIYSTVRRLLKIKSATLIKDEQQGKSAITKQLFPTANDVKVTTSDQADLEGLPESNSSSGEH